MRVPRFGALLDALPFTRRAKREFDTHTDIALKAQIDGRLEEALALWETTRQRWPLRPMGYCGVIVCARELRRFSYAADVLAIAREKFPDNTAVIAEAAQLAQRQDDWPRAAEFWELVADRPDAPVEYLQTFAFALFVLGRDERLEEIVRLMQRRFPDYHGPIAVEAMLATLRKDWDQALTLWSEYRRLYPDDRTGWENYGKAYQAREFAMLEQRGADPIDMVNPEEITVVEDEEARALFLSFESLGADCEFGLVQRRFGAEPLGLLRFNSVQFGGLVQALAHRLHAMGAPEHTELATLPNGEFFIRDRRWGLAMHTFLFKWSEDAEQLHAKFCKRVAFLKDKLLADLAEARKTFVFVSPTLRLDDLLMLHTVLKRLGNVSLLHVRPLGAPGAGLDFGKRAGEVVEIEPGLFVGYLSRPGRNAMGEWNIAFDEWVALCRETARLRSFATPVAVSTAASTAE